MADERIKFYYQDKEGDVRGTTSTAPTPDDKTVAEIVIEKASEENCFKTINGESIIGQGDITVGGGTTYTAGTNINISEENVISATDTNTWRNIKVNGVEKLGTGTGTGALDLVAGTNVTITEDSGAITINAAGGGSGGNIIYSFGSVFKDKIADALEDGVTRAQGGVLSPDLCFVATGEGSATLSDIIFSNENILSYISEATSDEPGVYPFYVNALTVDYSHLSGSTLNSFEISDGGSITNIVFDYLHLPCNFTDSSGNIINDMSAICPLVSFAITGGSESPSEWALIPMTDEIAIELANLEVSL